MAAAAKGKADKAAKWTRAAEDAFIEELAATSNVTKALKRVGLSSGGLYKHRAKSAEFRLRWKQALEEGQARLEADLLDEAVNGVLSDEKNGRGRIRKPASERVRLTLLQLHRRQAGEVRQADAEVGAALIVAAAAERKIMRLAKTLGYEW